MVVRAARQPSVSALIRLALRSPRNNCVVGVQDDGSAILPNGWRVKAAGTQVALDTFPMASAFSKDGRFLAVLNGGYKPPYHPDPGVGFACHGKSTKWPLDDAWLGLKFSPDGKFLYVGGGSRANVQELAFDNGKLKLSRTFTVVAEAERKHDDFIGDVTTSPDGHLIYAADLFHNRIVVINTSVAGSCDRNVQDWPPPLSDPLSSGRAVLFRVQLGRWHNLSTPRH